MGVQAYGFGGRENGMQLLLPGVLSPCTFKSTRRKKKKAQEGKRGHDSLVKSWVIKYNHYHIVFSESTYMYVVNG